MNITKRYSIELNKINNRLDDLKKGRIYELTRTPGDASYATLAQHLKEDIDLLISKIENDEPSITEKVAIATKNISPAASSKE